MGGNKNNKQTTSTGICQMDSKNINNNGNNDSNKQPQLGCVKWVAKNINNNNYNKKQPQLGYVKWVAKNINNNYNKNNLNWDMSNGWQKHRQQQQQQQWS